MELCLVRHGSPLVRAEISPTTWPLSADGRDRVRSLASDPRLAGVRHVFSSPEVKAVETAAILAAPLEAPPTVLDSLREAEWCGGFVADTSHWTARVARYLSGAPDDDFEPLSMVQNRWEDTLHAIRDAGCRGVVACVTHGRAMAIWLAVLSGDPGRAAAIWRSLTFPDVRRVVV